jgi:hypothetical protein
MAGRTPARQDRDGWPGGPHVIHTTTRAVDMSGSLPAVAGDMLQSLQVHRLLTARQLRVLHTPLAGLRWTQNVLARLTHQELVGYVHAGGGARRVYYLTTGSNQALQLENPQPGSRRATDNARQAASALSARTIAVNDVGLAFVAAARERGDQCGPLAWDHEVAHPIGTTAGRRAEVVIADAVLGYLQRGDDGSLPSTTASSSSTAPSNPPPRSRPSSPATPVSSPTTPRTTRTPNGTRHTPCFPKCWSS